MKKQSGFSSVLVILLLVAIAVIGVIGWRIIHTQSKNTNAKQQTTKLPKSNTAEKAKSPEAAPTFNFAGGVIRFDDNGAWKEATGGYWSNELKRCGRDTGPDSGCIDTKMLIPTNEVFTNADQFQVNISVFDKKDSIDSFRPSDVSAVKASTIPADKYSFEKYTADYSSNTEKEVRVTYIMETNENIIRVYSVFFDGDHYGFKSDTDYLGYQDELEELVKTITIK